MGRWLVGSSALLLLVAALLGGVIMLKDWAFAQIHDQERYLVAFADIDCDVPEGMGRREFLDEVQYLARLPDRLNLLDADLMARLRQAFAEHPWVEKVNDVTAAPPRHVSVRLAFRTPVLAVKCDGELRVVDGNGVLLPKNASAQGLPVYESESRPPRGPPGTRWGDPDIERAARKRKQ